MSNTVQVKPMDVGVMARRMTANNKTVIVWADGGVTGRFANFTGVPARCKGGADRLAAAWLFAGEVELYDETELEDLYAAALKIAKVGGEPGDVRAEFARKQRATCAPVWETETADRDGNIVTAWWLCPRLVWPGLAVYRERSKYSVFRVVDGTAYPTGFSASNLPDLRALLESICGVSDYGATE